MAGRTLTGDRHSFAAGMYGWGRLSVDLRWMNRDLAMTLLRTVSRARAEGLSPALRMVAERPDRRGVAG